jgi:hypothetical protein
LRKYVDAADCVAYYRYSDLTRRTGTKRPDGGNAYFSHNAAGNRVAARDEQGWTLSDPFKHWKTSLAG